MQARKPTRETRNSLSRQQKTLVSFPAVISCGSNNGCNNENTNTYTAAVNKKLYLSYFSLSARTPSAIYGKASAVNYFGGLGDPCIVYQLSTICNSFASERKFTHFIFSGISSLITKKKIKIKIHKSINK